MNKPKTKKQKTNPNRAKGFSSMEVQLVINREAKFLSLWWEIKNEDLGDPDADT